MTKRKKLPTARAPKRNRDLSAIERLRHDLTAKVKQAQYERNLAETSRDEARAKAAALAETVTTEHSERCRAELRAEAAEARAKRLGWALLAGFDMLGEYVRQTMHQNPEWAPGIRAMTEAREDALRATGQAAPETCCMKYGDPVPSAVSDSWVHPATPAGRIVCKVKPSASAPKSELREAIAAAVDLRQPLSHRQARLLADAAASAIAQELPEKGVDHDCG